MKVLWKHWWKSFALAFILLLLFGWWYGGFTDTFIINRVLADVGTILIGISFALSGFCYFFKTHRLLLHRKYLGLVGFALVFVHGVMSLPLFKLSFYLSTPQHLLSFILGIISLLFFVWLAVISTDYWIRRLKKKWRVWLRWGYAVFVLGLIHVFILYHRIWMRWFANPLGFPAPSLVVMVFGILVLLLRLALFLKVKK